MADVQSAPNSKFASDQKLIYAMTFMRALAIGQLAVLLGVYLAQRNFSTTAIGIVIGAGLWGGAASTLVATFLGDRLGRRRFLFALALASGLGGLALIYFQSVPVLAVTAFFGMLNGMGRDRGAALVLEQSALSTMVPDAARTKTFAIYNMLQDFGNAFGGLLAGLPVLLRHNFSLPDNVAFNGAIWFYVGLNALLMAASLLLTPAVEVPRKKLDFKLTPQSKRVLTKISALFAIDSIAGGFLTTSLVSLFFYQRFHVNEGTVGLLFFGARGLNAFSHLGAAFLAKRIGLVNTMVFTHIPSSVLLMTVAIAPSFWVAAVLFLIRESLVEMDVPTRQSYLMAMMQPDERTFAAGITGLVRLGGWATAPALAGFFMQGLAMGLPLATGASMKIVYDVLLYRAFNKVKPPEEVAT